MQLRTEVLKVVVGRAGEGKEEGEREGLVKEVNKTVLLPEHY